MKLILQGAESLGLLRETKGRRYVDLNSMESGPTDGAGDSRKGTDLDDSGLRDDDVDPPKQTPSQVLETTRVTLEDRKKLVLITHGKNTSFLEPIKNLLAFGGLEPVVSVEQQTVSKPVPDKVLEDMRRCGAAIIHVDAEQSVIDSQGNKHTLLNGNVLIEIGAAMALYGRRFILLVKQNVDLPSNLQGLYEVRYEGEKFDDSIMSKLMKAVNDIKNNSLPDEESSY